MQRLVIVPMGSLDFLNQKIWIRRTWIKGKEGKGKSAASRTHVPLSGKLASYLIEWKRQSAYTKPTDFVFPSLKLSGKKPRSGSQFVKDYVRPFLVKHGVISKDYRGRCGLHVFCHSLTSVMIGEKLADPKTVQSLLRHANSKVTMDVYAHALDDVKLAAQERWVERVENASMVQ
jgi:integrase